MPVGRCQKGDSYEELRNEGYPERVAVRVAALEWADCAREGVMKSKGAQECVCNVFENIIF